MKRLDTAATALHSSTKKYQIDSSNLSLVAFVQDMKTKTVLQTVYVKLNPATTASTTAAMQ